MKKTWENELVSLRFETEESCAIIHDQEVGKIQLNQKGEFAEVYFSIIPEYRQRHYASNGLYLFTQYAHKELKLNELRAYVPKENHMARHVVEHSGYHIVLKEESGILYAHTLERTSRDDGLVLLPEQRALYLAGGCFWGMERVFKLLDGVVSTRTGYANGTLENPSYEDIIRNETGFKECVRVIYDLSQISTETILKAYFLCIDPTVKNEQKGDVGTQYQTGVYYRDDTLLEAIESVFQEERKKTEQFYVELKPLEVFFEAEEYHQNYLEKNPDGYCHITLVDLNKVKALNHKGD